LDGVAELAALALGVPSTFICLEIGNQCRIVASHGLSGADISVAEILCGNCLRSSSRVTRQANPTGPNPTGPNSTGQKAHCPDDSFWMATPLAADSDGRIRGALGCRGEAGKLGALSPEQERTLKILQERISSRLRVHGALLESIQHHRFAMELDPLVRWTADARGNLLDLNESWHDLTGGARDRALGGAWRDYVHPDDRAGALRAFNTALRQGTPIDVRFRLRSATGEWRWARTRARARHGRAGELLRWYGTTEDIHDQVTAERALRENSAQLHTVINQAMVGILHRDLDGRVLTVNERYCELVGRSAAQLDGLPMGAFTHPEESAWNMALYAEHAVSGAPFQIEKRYLRPDGSSLWCAVHVSFVRDEHGVPCSSITVAQDIAARRQAEIELRESKDLLQTVIDSVSDLIFVKDRGGRFVLVNKAMREGCDLAQEVPPELFDSDMHRTYREADALVMLGGTPVAFDEMVEFEGQLHPFETIKVPWRKGEEIAGVIGVSRDIAERIKGEAALRESEEHYRYSVELNHQVPWTAKPDGSIEEVGPQWSDFTGTDRARARGHGWLDALHRDDVARVTESWQKTLQSREPIDIEYRLRRGDRSYRWVRVRASPRLDAAGNVVRWYGTLEDIDDHRRSQDALRHSEERFRLAAQAARLGIWDYDPARGTREWSGELRAILGLPPDAAAVAETAIALVHPDDRQRVRVMVDAAAIAGSDQRFELTFRIFRADDGQLRWVCANGWRTDGDSGQPSRVLVAVRDITDARTADDRIHWAARHDALTRLPNRAAFQDALDDAMQHALPLAGTIGLVLVDVDHLKQTNDCFGHDAGDALLRTIADRLQTIAAEHGFTARLGGDEFALLFSGPTAEREMARASTQLGPVLGEAFVHEARILDCRATSGGSLFPQDGSNGSELLKAADMALYSAKAHARGGLMMFRPEMRADLERRSAMISMARTAIDDEQVTPFFQPKVELSSGRLVGFEALLRWQHPHRGLLPPGEISAAFDNLDLALALSDRMFDQTIALMRTWLDDGVKFGTIAINAASAEFRHDDLAERILERLERAKVPAALLELEVTETVFLGGGADHVDRALLLLSGAGVKIALDDFGTGYASLSHLKHYPVDTIKIDRSFVCNLENGAGDAAIVNAVINLGASLGMDIVAEGIETEAQARYLRKHGCGFGQGYLFGRATAPSTIPALVSSWQPPGSTTLSRRKR
jgi:diguanylate cyclase (GGDEF)-like protein/PAS domain S-box-containing protein